jgi:hypothetical protein
MCLPVVRRFVRQRDHDLDAVGSRAELQRRRNLARRLRMSTLRRRVAILTAALAAALLAACGETEDVASPRATELVLLAVNPSVGRARYELRCNPPGGDLPDPERACGALGADPTLVTDPEPFTCWGGTFSSWDLTVTGHFRGDDVDTQVSTCWTPQMELLDELGLGRDQPRLLPRRTRTLQRGESATYPPGQLEPGDLVVCLAQGKRLEVGVGFPGHGPRLVGWDATPDVAATVETRQDGSVHAECDTPAAHGR